MLPSSNAFLQLRDVVDIHVVGIHVVDIHVGLHHKHMLRYSSYSKVQNTCGSPWVTKFMHVPRDTPQRVRGDAETEPR